MLPILSVVSIGTRQPFTNRLIKLNRQITTTYLRQSVSPYFRRSSARVSSTDRQPHRSGALTPSSGDHGPCICYMTVRPACH